MRIKAANSGRGLSFSSNSSDGFLHLLQLEDWSLSKRALGLKKVFKMRKVL